MMSVYRALRRWSYLFQGIFLSFLNALKEIIDMKLRIMEVDSIFTE